MSFSLTDIPIIGPALSEGYQTITGHPNDIKAAYDKAIASSLAGGQQIKDFLLGREGAAQKFYAPVQNMFTQAYGSRGIQPVMNQGGGSPFTSAFGGGGMSAPDPDPGLGSARR